MSFLPQAYAVFRLLKSLSSPFPPAFPLHGEINFSAHLDIIVFLMY